MWGWGCPKYFRKQNLFSKIKAVDLSRENVIIAKEKNKKVEIYQGDFLNIKEKFDMVIMLEVLEHIENDEGALTYIAKNLLSKDGLFLLSVPSSKAANLPNFGHYRHYKREELAKLLTKSGFKVLLFYSYGTKLINRLGELVLRKKYGLRNGHKTMREATQESARLEFPFIYRRILYPVLSHFFFIFYLFDYCFLKDTNRGVGYLVLCQLI